LSGNFSVGLAALKPYKNELNFELIEQKIRINFFLLERRKQKHFLLLFRVRIGLGCVGPNAQKIVRYLTVNVAFEFHIGKKSFG
jgi:hypothetical protein